MSPVNQTARIQVRRGLLANLPQLASGELGFAIDTQQLYIGNGTLAEGAPFLGNTLLSGNVSGGGGGGNAVPIFTLVDNIPSPTNTGLVAPTTNAAGIITYAIDRNGIGRSGEFSYAISAPSTLSWDDNYNGSNAGIALSAVLSGDTVIVQYTATATGQNATFLASVNSL